jgi:hypothetical protein
MRDARSLRFLWRMYKWEMLKLPGVDRWDLVLAQGAFYAGARVTWKVLYGRTWRSQVAESTA